MISADGYFCQIALFYLILPVALLAGTAAAISGSHSHYICVSRYSIIISPHYLLCDDGCFRRILFDPIVLINAVPFLSSTSLVHIHTHYLPLSCSFSPLLAQPLLPTFSLSSPFSSPTSSTYVHKRANRRSRVHAHACTRIQVYLGRIRYYSRARSIRVEGRGIE